MIRSLGKFGVKLMKIPGWQQIMLTAGTAILGYAVKKMSGRISSRSNLRSKLERIGKLRAGKVISEEEYEILRRNVLERYGCK